MAGVIATLLAKKSESHLIWDPETGEFVQFFPFDRSARTLANWGPIRVNRSGKVHIQVEVLGYAKDAPLRDGPMVGFERLLKVADEWGISRDWPAGPPHAYPDPGKANRPAKVWLTKGGHYAHSQVPGNSHGDPGLIDPSKWIRKVEQMAAWQVGDSQMVKPEAAVTVEGGKWVTLAKITIPKGGRFLATLQIRMPRGIAAGEAQLGRIGWGVPGQAVDSTGHNPIPPASAEQRWRTPVHHELAGGGPLAFQVWLPPGSHQIRFVAKATRFA
jgi:hypothetical protein